MIFKVLELKCLSGQEKLAHTFVTHMLLQDTIGTLEGGF